MTGGGQGPASLEISELDERISAIIGETALSGVPATDDLDSDLATVTVPSPALPCSEPEGELVKFYLMNIS